MYKLVLALLLTLSASQTLCAQKIFSEGVIKYDVYLNGNTTPEGVYIVTVKNNLSRRELAMNSGYNNILIYNHKTGTTVSLNVDQENKYALSMTATEVQEKNKRFEKAVFTPSEQKKKLAGYACNASKVRYPNGEEATFYYTGDLIPPNESFNTMFPGLQGIPLEYEVKSSANTTIRFAATALETKSIDLITFDIPKDYKIVTKQELEKIK